MEGSIQPPDPPLPRLVEPRHERVGGGLGQAQRGVDERAMAHLDQLRAGNLTRAHLQTDTPFNTYTRHGLPPTPICSPGAASLHAALHPAAGDALYFVARGDGTHVFSPTLAAHNAAVREFQQKTAKP